MTGRNGREQRHRFLAEGRGVTADAVEGREWIARAADAGFTEAQVMFGEMLINPSGGPADHPKAQGLFQKAAATGHVGAMFALGALAGGGYV
jgi:TPR repeat protein